MSIGYIQQRVRGLYAQLYRDNESFMNWTEARLLATRNARFRAKLNALLLEKRADVARLIEYFYRRLGTPSPVPPETMAMAFMSLYDGVQLWGLYGPAEMTADRAESILTLFIDSLILLARLQATPDQLPHRMAARTRKGSVSSPCNVLLSRKVGGPSS